MIFVKVDKQTGLVLSKSIEAISPDPTLFLEIETSFDFSNHNNDYRWNAADSTFYDVGTKPEVVSPTIHDNSAFSSKYVYVDGDKKSLYKRIHGISLEIPAGTTGFLDFTIPHPHCKFTGARIMGVDLKDTLDFFILDTSTNTYSGAPGSFFVLNQFGFDVQMPPTGEYSNTSNYDADLYENMVVSCAYKNEGLETRYISMNVILHEVK